MAENKFLFEMRVVPIIPTYVLINGMNIFFGFLKLIYLSEFIKSKTFYKIIYISIYIYIYIYIYYIYITFWRGIV
ncbi:hypothetical protein C2G38_2099561, partial [Gigaspora rosea]